MEKKRPKGSKQIRQEKRGGKLFWGYHVWLRQADGSRKQVRDFSFNTKEEAKEALRVVQTAGWKTRYGLIVKKESPTTIETVAARYASLASAKRLSQRSEDTTYWRDRPGHILTLQRFVNWAASGEPPLERPITLVKQIDSDVITYWIAAEIDRAHKGNKTLKQATIKRGLNTILASLHGAVNSEKFQDLKHYKVPVNPLKKWQVEEDRDRVLSEEELTRIGDALKQNPRYEEAAFFFQLAVMTGGRFAELKRMKWNESSVTFGIKLKSTKTGGRWRTIIVPDAAQLIAKRKQQQGRGVAERVFTAEYEYFSETFKLVSESLNIPYGQRVQNGWTIHDIRHTCLTNMALEGIPLHAIKEFAGHRNISETIRYLKYMPQQKELGAQVSSRLGLLAGADLDPHPTQRQSGEVECPKCNHTFSVKKPKHLKLVEQVS